MKRIIVQNVCKSFIKRKREVFLRILLGRVLSKRFVLDNMSFYVEKGEIVGLTGSNGIGKSTLLRIISGIYTKDSGTILTKGKIIALLNLKLGLLGKLTMHDNILLMASIFDIPLKKIKTVIPKIITFSGLNDYIDTPVYQFSEGMKQRLIFSVAIHADGDILLLDEIFEVGDKEFRKKSRNAIQNFAKKGGSVLLVSHSESILKYCDRVIEL